MTVKTINPIDLTFDLNCEAPHAFQAFTDHFGKWWPLATHSVAGAKATNCHFEVKEGGRIYEIAEDGTEHDWGKVLAVEVPTRLKFTWHPGRDAARATEVEITFAETNGKTAMHLIHRGWENYGDGAEETRAGYEPGWQFVAGERFGGYIAGGH